jgi:hypothetical protein
MQHLSSRLPSVDSALAGGTLDVELAELRWTSSRTEPTTPRRQAASGTGASTPMRQRVHPDAISRLPRSCTSIPSARGRVSRRLCGYSEDSCGWGDSP